MATTATITPTLGSAPVTLQAGNYSAIDDRRAWGILTSEYANDSNSYKVIQRAAGANMTVDVGSSSGEAVVTGDSVTAQGNYTVPRTASNVNVDIAAADATNPRNDLVVLEVKDDQHDASGLNLARVRVITGTPNASAALTDAPGANGTPALPSSAMLLAVVRVAAGATSITTAAISDRRAINPVAPWQDYTPTLTNLSAGTNGTVLARYCQFGKTVHFYFQFTYSTTGTPSSVGTVPTVGLPVTSRASRIANVSAYAVDTGVTSYGLQALPEGTTSVQLYAWNAAGTYLTSSSVSATVPFTFGNGDVIYVQGTYEAI